MKKICLVLFIFMFALSGMTAVESMSKSKNIGIVIIGNNDVKSEKYFQRSAAIFDVEKNPNVSVEVGESIQQKYYDYCKDKEINENEAPKLENLLEFTAQNNFDRMLCLVIKNPEVSKSQNESYLGFGRVGLKEFFTISMTVNAYLCDQTQILKAHSVTKQKTQDDKHSHDPEAKAKRGAFTLCINDIGKAIKGLW